MIDRRQRNRLIDISVLRGTAGERSSHHLVVAKNLLRMKDSMEVCEQRNSEGSELNKEKYIRER